MNTQENSSEHRIHPSRVNILFSRVELLDQGDNVLDVKVQRLGHLSVRAKSLLLILEQGKVKVLLG